MVMKKHSTFWLLTGSCVFVTLFYAGQTSAQMKIGNHPTQINKASILELESSRQGLLLPRIADTAAMTPLNPPDGMIIYSEQARTLLIRSGFQWKNLVDGGGVPPVGSPWDISGNTGTDSALHFLGTTGPTGLRIGTNNTPAILISRNGTVAFPDSITVGGSARFDRSVEIEDSLVLRTVRAALPSDREVLMISAEGVIRSLSIDSLKTAASLSGASLNLVLDTVALSAGKPGPWIDSLSRKTDSTIVLNLPDAAPGVRGLLTDSTQTIAGTKFFSDSLAIGAPGIANSNLQVNGNVSMATVLLNSGNGYDMTDAALASCRTVIVDVTSLSGEYTIALPAAGADLNGRLYTIKKIGREDDAQLDNDVKIIPAGGDTFEDAGTEYYIYNNFTAVTLQARDGKWYFVR